MKLSGTGLLDTSGARVLRESSLLANLAVRIFGESPPCHLHGDVRPVCFYDGPPAICLHFFHAWSLPHGDTPSLQCELAHKLRLRTRIAFSRSQSFLTSSPCRQSGFSDCSEGVYTLAYCEVYLYFLYFFNSSLYKLPRYAPSSYRSLATLSVGTRSRPQTPLSALTKCAYIGSRPLTSVAGGFARVLCWCIRAWLQRFCTFPFFASSIFKINFFAVL